MASSIGTRKWRELRLEILARDNYTCYICGNPEANQVDHIHPRSRGGEDTPDNLSAICKRCNTKKSDKVVKSGVFLTDRTPPQSFVNSFFPKPVEVGGEDSQVVLKSPVKPVDKTAVTTDGQGAVMGSPVPRVHTALQEGDLERAYNAIEFAERIGIQLMPWQRNVLGEMLKTKDDSWVYRSWSLITGRQQGKTYLSTLRILAGVYLFGEKDILMMAVNRKLSLMTFRQIDHFVRTVPELRQEWINTYTTNGAERMTFKNGAQISIVAATPNGSRGFSADLLFVDELRAIDQETFDAAIYTTNARKAQIVTVSNAGSKESKVLNDLRERALSGSAPSLGWFEWSAHPSRDIMDVEGWKESCPALGHFLSFETLDHLARTNDPMAFRCEVLCQWVDNVASPFEPQSFEQNADPSIVLTEGGDLFFAFDKSHTQRHAALVAGQKVGDVVNLFVLQVWNSQHPIDEVRLASDINVHVKKWRPRVVMYDKFMTQNTATYLSASGVPLQECSGRNQVEASHRFAQMLVSKSIRHRDEKELNDSIASCSSKITENGWRLVRRRSSGEICAAICAAMVSWQAGQPQSVPVLIVN